MLLFLPFQEIPGAATAKHTHADTHRGGCKQSNGRMNLAPSPGSLDPPAQCGRSAYPAEMCRVDGPTDLGGTDDGHRERPRRQLRDMGKRTPASERGEKTTASKTGRSTACSKMRARSSVGEGTNADRDALGVGKRSTIDNKAAKQWRINILSTARIY